MNVGIYGSPMERLGKVIMYIYIIEECGCISWTSNCRSFSGSPSEEVQENPPGFGGGTTQLENPPQPFSQPSSQENRHVVFTGNGYAAEWRQEAAKRGLPNLTLGEGGKWGGALHGWRGLMRYGTLWHLNS